MAILTLIVDKQFLQLNPPIDTVDGRNPKQPPFGCKKNLVNNGR